MKQLIDLFAPREVLHMVGIANRLKILETGEKKYLLAVRMGAKKDAGTDSWELDDEEKERFYPLFSRFIRLFPAEYDCVRESCPICGRFRELKKDFSGPGASEEYGHIMRWVSRSRTHYESGEQDSAPEQEDSGRRTGKVKRIRVVARKPRLDRTAAREREPEDPFIRTVKELSRTRVEELEGEQLLEYALRSRALFGGALSLLERFSSMGAELCPGSALPRTAAHADVPGYADNNE